MLIKNQKARAGELINSKAEYNTGGMEGYATLSLIDDNGYPSVDLLLIVWCSWLTALTLYQKEFFIAIPL